MMDRGMVQEAGWQMVGVELSPSNSPMLMPWDMGTTGRQPLSYQDVTALWRKTAMDKSRSEAWPIPCPHTPLALGFGMSQPLEGNKVKFIVDATHL